MDLDQYDAAAARDLLWFAERLRSEGVAAVWRSAIALGANGIEAILAAKRGDIVDFIGMSDVARDATLSVLAAPVDRHGFLIASTYVARCGAAWLEFACQFGVSAGHNPGPRFLLHRAGSAALALRDAFPTLWPFDEDPDYPDPFGSCDP